MMRNLAGFFMDFLRGTMLNFENCDKLIFPGVRPYDIPAIEAEKDLRIDKLDWIPFNYAKSAKNRQTKGVHFYLDDYQFARVWNRPDEYIPLLRQFAAVTSPDFSTYTNMPAAMQIYNHYRKHWLAAYWQLHGIRVIPTVSWSTSDSYAWCFDGEPVGGIVSVSSVGTQRSEAAKQLFREGCREMVQRLRPEQILWYGKGPEEFDWNLTRIKPHQELIRERRRAKYGR